MNLDLTSLTPRQFRLIDLLICLPFLVVPLFLNLPFRVNIFLSWEGAYRLYLGQMPFKDFGLPLGYGYWLIPALFFKLLGPTLTTLVKSQIFINLISLLSLRGIFYNLKIKPVLVSLALLAFCITYVLYNFWPWYNHSVIVYELASLYFITYSLTNIGRKTAIVSLILGGFLAFLSFFTKQDAGAICFALGLCLLGHLCITEKKYSPLLIYAGSFFATAAIFILPFIGHGFFYWFNLGQEPHSSRISLALLLDVIFTQAHWEKVYLSIFLILLIASGREQIRDFVASRERVYLWIISIGLIGQAIVTRMTSPLPTDHMTYFHAFGLVLLISHSLVYPAIGKLKNIAALVAIVLVSFSAGYWKYLKGYLGLSISKHDAEIPWNSDPWTVSSIEGFENVKMPVETVKGIKKLLASDIAQKENLKVLNMTELTPLALEMGYTPPTDQPLWYHLNIGIFQKEVDEFCERIKKGEYDLVLFQDIPGLIHFFPFQVRDTLREYYHLENTFLAPRKLENSVIEVYVKKQEPHSESTGLRLTTSLEHPVASE